MATKKASKKSPLKPLRFAIVGTGGMANVHATEFLKNPGVEIAAVCDVSGERASAFAMKHAPKAAVFTDFAKLLREERVDAVANVTPDSLHAPLSLQAIAAGCHIFCEKPLATSYGDALKMVKAAKKAGVINMVNFTYRNAPAIQKARDLVQSGQLGEIVHIEASYLQSWLVSKAWGVWNETPAWLWRLSSKHGSRGVLGDVGVHILDFASLPVGSICKVSARLKTFKKIKGKRIGEYPLDANDSALMTVEFANGALGVIHTTRFATGYPNSLALRVHGTKGALRIDLDKSYDTLEVCLGENVDKYAWETMKVPPVLSTYQRFVEAIRSGKNGEPDFARGAEIQKILDACFESDKEGRAIKV
jgi:predicted dehydrogenase